MDDVVDYKQQKFRQAKDEVFESVYLGEGVQELLMALDGSLHEGPAVRCKLPWPMNLPTALLVVELATREVHSIGDFPYLAARQSAGASSPIARKLRRSLRSAGSRA